MKTTLKNIWGMAKVSLKQSKTAYLITGILFALGVAQLIVQLSIPPNPDNQTLAVANYLFVLPIFIAIFIAARHFSRIMNLGGKRKDFFWTCLPLYAAAAFAVSLAGTILTVTVDALCAGKIGIMNLWDIFGFMRRGPVVAFFQMGALLLLAACAAHTLTLIQSKWYGYVTDALIIAVISVFTPIAPLRSALAWFFKMIIFHEIAIAQIVSCLFVTALVYGASLFAVRRKTI
ncbi:MAG: hypothetical protein LBL66_06905 [Clostridiales bacterium]|jgi:hypothetical protein|nr:hypothetical protein [Clostridiales bacterium]